MYTLNPWEREEKIIHNVYRYFTAAAGTNPHYSVHGVFVSGIVMEWDHTKPLGKLPPASLLFPNFQGIFYMEAKCPRGSQHDIYQLAVRTAEVPGSSLARSALNAELSVLVWRGYRICSSVAGIQNWMFWSRGWGRRAWRTSVRFKPCTQNIHRLLETEEKSRGSFPDCLGEINHAGRIG